MQAGRPLAALVYVALAPGGRAKRDHVAELLWPGGDLSEARHSLRQSLYRLRQATDGVPLVRLRGIELEVQPSVRLDCLDGERIAADGDLAGAYEALRGTFLEGFSIPESREFESWIESQRIRFGEAWARVGEALAAHLLDTGDPARALEVAEELAAARPFSDQVARLHMTALVAAGRHATAVARYHAYAALLQRELEAEPGSELALYARQLESSLGARPEPSAAVLPFVGRARQWSALDAAWERVQRGGGATMLVEGPAGLGKSRLIDELAGHVRGAGGAALIGRSYDIERAVPYGAIANALSPIVGRPEVAGLSPAWLAEAARLLPELRERFARLPDAPDDSGSPAARRRLHEALARCVEAVAEDAPVLLAVDDVHWADGPSLEILHFLSHRLRGSRVLLLASYRPTDLGPAARQFARALCSARLADLLTLGPLTAADVLDLLTRLGGFDDPAVGNAIAEHLETHTGGSPLLLNEVLDTLARKRVLRVRDGRWLLSSPSGVAGVPHTLGKLMTERMEGLAPWIRACVDTLAVAAAETPVEVVADAVQLSEPRTELALAVLEEERLVKRAPAHAFELVHDEFRRLVYEAIGDERRRQLHAAVGAALESRGESKRPGGPARLAFHFGQAGRHEPARRYAAAAAAEAEGLAADAEHGAHLAVVAARAPDAAPPRPSALTRRRFTRWSRRATVAGTVLVGAASVGSLYLAAVPGTPRPEHRSDAAVPAGEQPTLLPACDAGTTQVGGGPAGPVALPQGSVITASGTWHSGTTPDVAFDGDTTTLWNAGAFPGLWGQWIQVDFGAPRSLVGIEATVSQFTRAGLTFATSHEVTLDGAAAFSWSDETSDGQVLSFGFATPRQVQVVRITTTVTPSWVAWKEIRFVFDAPTAANCLS